MNLEKMKSRYSDEEFKHVEGYISDLFNYFEKIHVALESVTDDLLEEYMRVLIESGENEKERLLAVARYFYYYDLSDQYIFMTSIFGSLGVVSSINDKSKKVIGKSLELEIPVLGTTPKCMVSKTKRMMEELRELPENVYREILADNHHGIPREAMLDEKAFYDKSSGLEDYLRERHERKVHELQRHHDTGEIWYEQQITQDIVDYVRDNQEILSGVYDDGYIYITKFPYNPDKFLKAESPLDKRYHYCHCPFAKASIMTDEPIDSEWCYCSAGFAKYPFEVILDQKLEVELLESVLKGDPRCRFRIRWDNEY